MNSDEIQAQWRLSPEDEARLVAELDMAPGRRLALDALGKLRSLGALPDQLPLPTTGEVLDFSEPPEAWAEPARRFLAECREVDRARRACQTALAALATGGSKTQHVLDYGLEEAVTVEQPSPRYAQDALRSIRGRYRGLLSTLAEKGHQVLAERTELRVRAAAVRALANYTSEPIQNLLQEIREAEAPSRPRVKVREGME